MLDTVIINLNSNQFVPISGNGIPAWDLHSRSGGYTKSVKTMTKEQKDRGLYLPRPRLIQRGKGLMVQIEFSVPKLLFSNNVQEVNERDFPFVLETLENKLAQIGIAAKVETLVKAKVSSFHISKNILLSEGYTARGVIQELCKINFHERFDLTKVTFANEGQSLQCYTNSHSLVFYDKVRDLNKPKKRAIDRDQTPQQFTLFQQIRERPIEIVRMEVRLAKKRKMDEVLEQLGYKRDPCFRDIFSKEVCRSVLRLYWDTITSENLFLFAFGSNPLHTLMKVKKEHPSVSGRKAIYFVGLDCLVKDNGGVRRLRQMLDVDYPYWYRIATELEMLNFTDASYHNWVHEIEQQIDELQPLKITSITSNK